MNRAIGYDSSKYDIYLRPDESSQPVDFIILRTGYGMMEDGIFVDSARNIDILDSIKMVYHYLSSGSPWKEQIKRHLEICEKAPWVPAFHWIDFENAYNEMSISFAMECSQAIKYLCDHDKKAGIYTNLNLYNNFFSLTPGAKDVPLWLSWPVDRWDKPPNIDKYKPILPAGRDDWDIWQHSYRGNGTLFGAGRDYAFCLDVYNGTPNEMRKKLEIDAVIPDEPEDPYKKGFITAIERMEINLNVMRTEV